MSASVWQALRAASGRAQPHACRYVGGRRLPHPQRTLHTSSTRRREDDPANTPAIWNQVVDLPTTTKESAAEQQKLASGPDDPPEKRPRSKDPTYYGSASRRAGRNVRRVKELPEVVIPSWLFERNAITNEELVERQSAVREDAASASMVEGRRSSDNIESPTPQEPEQPSIESAGTPNEPPVNHYLARHMKINENVLGEVISLIHA
ncbi:MAG: hypothetical protein Q9164_006166, partial [Protoblastenia rupestris]